jgi:hypothetical protein
MGGTSLATVERTPWGSLPSDWATLYHNLPYDEVLGGGSAGPGKTAVLLEDPLPQIFVEHQRCLFRSEPDHLEQALTGLGIPRLLPNPLGPEHSDIKSRDTGLRWGESVGWALHLRRTLKMLRQSILRSHKIFPKVDPEAKWDDSEATWIFKSGFRFQFGHCQHASSWEDHMGIEYSHLGFDELVQFDKEQYEQIVTRVRSSDAVLMAMLKTRSMSNPTMIMDAEDTFSVKDPYWVRRYFHMDEAPDGKVEFEREVDMEDGTTERSSLFFLPASIDDNPNKVFVRKYKAKLMMRPLHIREALLKGNWFFTPGSYYGEVWNDRLHAIAPFRIPEDWPIFRSMDWGFKHHGCVHWWTMDPDGNLICIREMFFIGKTDIEVAKMIKNVEEPMGLWRQGRSLITGPADTQLWEQRGQSHTRSMATNFAMKGVAWVKCDKGKTMQRAAELLLGRLGDHKDGSTVPGIMFFRTCPNAMRALKAILTDPKNTAAPLDGGEHSHAHDSIRYACTYASKGRRGIGKMRKTKDPWEVEKESSPNAGKTGTYFGYGTA